MPELSARIVIVRAGAVGCGVAFQLAEAGITDALVLERGHVLAGRYELEVAGERVPAEVFLEPAYDPKGLRIRA